MNIAQNIFKLLTTLVVVGVVMGVVFIQTTAYLQNQKLQVTSQAVDGCLQSSQYTFSDPATGVTTVEPIEKSYLKCLELKGLSK